MRGRSNQERPRIFLFAVRCGDGRALTEEGKDQANQFGR